MQLRKMLWWITLPPSLLLLALLLLYLSLPTLLPLLLTELLERQQIEVKALQLQKPTHQRLTISTATLYKETPEYRLLVHLDGVKLDYSFAELLHSRTINKIHSAAVNIEYYQKPIPSAENNLESNLPPILPQFWLQQLPTDQFQLDKVTFKYQEEDRSIRGRLSLKGDKRELSSNGILYLADKRPVKFTSSVNTNDQFSINLFSSDKALLSLSGHIAVSDKNYLIDSDKTLSLRQSQELITGYLDSATATNLVTELSGEISSSSRITIPIDTELSSFNSKIELSGSYRLAADFTLPAVEKLSADVSGHYTLHNGELSLSIAANSSVSGSQIKTNTLNSPIENFAAEIRSELSLFSTLEELAGGSYPEISPFNLKLSTQPLSVEQLNLGNTSLEFQLSDIDPARQQIRAQLTSEPLQLSYGGKELPKLTLKSQLFFDYPRLYQHSRINNTSLGIDLFAKSTVNLSSLSGAFSWQLKPIKLSALDGPLHRFLPVPEELQLIRGSLEQSANGMLERGQLTANFENQINGVDFLWQEVEFNGLNLQSKTRISSQGNIADKGSIQLDSVKSGIEATELRGNYHWQLQEGISTISVEGFEAKLLDGRVNLSPVSSRTDQISVTTGLVLNKIDLGELLKLEQQEGLTGEGKLAGYFPLKYSNKQLQINNGELYSLAPGGKIRFQPNEAVSQYALTNPGLKMALQALENFHYSDLSVKLDYTPEGTAYLKTRLQGNNPDWNRGHPVDFTINIEENIPQLLKALQFTDKLTNTIEKRYR